MNHYRHSPALPVTSYNVCGPSILQASRRESEPQVDLPGLVENLI